MRFSFDDDKIRIEMEPDNNSALLYLGMPGAKCVVDSITPGDDGIVIFEGEMSASTPSLVKNAIDLHWS